MQNQSRIALLIDADNTPYTALDNILSHYGRMAVKRAYGNWSKPCLRNWESVLHCHGIRAVQQFDCTPGKNATDIALTVDAMELLHTGLYDTFIIAASDSDYAPLVMHLRESGAHVIGIGKEGAPAAYANACDEFRTLESFLGLVDDLNIPIDTSFLFDDDDAILEDISGKSIEEDGFESIEDTPAAEISNASDEDDDDFDFPPIFGLDEHGDIILQDFSSPDENHDIIWDSIDDLDIELNEGGTVLVDEDVWNSADCISFSGLMQEETADMKIVHTLLQMAYYICKEENGFAKLSAAGNLIHEIRPEFDCRNYGFKKLHQLLLAYPDKYQVIYYPTKTHAKVVAFRCCD